MRNDISTHKEQIGYVKSINTDRGFAFVTAPGDTDYFLHISGIPNEFKSLDYGTCVVFSVIFDQNRGHERAVAARILRRMDWAILFSYLGREDSVSFTVTRQKRMTRQRVRTFRDIQHSSIISIGLHQLIDGDAENIKNNAIEYMHTILKPEDFVRYCNHLRWAILDQQGTGPGSETCTQLFTEFGNNLTAGVLFYTWKSKRFDFIGKVGSDYEIEEKVLQQFIKELSIEDVKRIKEYEFGDTFSNKWVSETISSSNDRTWQELKAFYEVLTFDTSSKKMEVCKTLDELYVKKAKTWIIETGSQLPEIVDDSTYAQYSVLRGPLGIHVTSEVNSEIRNFYRNLISERTAKAFGVELWLNESIDCPDQSIEAAFFDCRSIQKQALILKTAREALRIKLFNKLIELLGVEYSYTVLENTLKLINNFGYGFSLTTHLTDKNYWSDKAGVELVQAFNSEVQSLKDVEMIVRLYESNIIKEFSVDFIVEHHEKIYQRVWSKVFRQKNLSTHEKLVIASRRFEKDGWKALSWILPLLKDELPVNDYRQWVTECIASMSSEQHFFLWKDGIDLPLPKAYLLSFIKSNNDFTDEFQSYLEDSLMSRDEAALLISESMTDYEALDTMPVFLSFLRRTEFVHKKLPRFLDCLPKIPEVHLMNWALDDSALFDFELLKKNFILFDGASQVRIFKKLFFLKQNKQLELSIDDLLQISRVDYDLYSTSKVIHEDVKLDLSTEIIILALASVAKSGKFLIQGELLNVVLTNATEDPKKKFRLGNYFSTCSGRSVPRFSSNWKGEVHKVQINSNTCFGITFPSGEHHVIEGRWGPYERFERNPHFDHLLEQVKQLPYARWNTAQKQWLVSSVYETEVRAFATKNKFKLCFGDENRENLHLLVFRREEIQKNSFYCDGVKGYEPDRRYGLPVWWCNRQSCFETCAITHNVQNWEDFSLLDFCRILGINTNGKKGPNEIENGLYNQFVTLINRFNQLLERLYCSNCNHILHPIENGYLSAYNVVNFCCENSTCSQHKVPIYLNHCLNGQCSAIIDSRETKKCPNGLYICPGCGSCCSHGMMSRRRDLLREKGAFIHPNLEAAVQSRSGHLERAMYFCFKCAGGMTETVHDVFECLNCNTKYDTRKFKLERPHRQSGNQRAES